MRYPDSWDLSCLRQIGVTDFVLLARLDQNVDVVVSDRASDEAPRRLIAVPGGR